MMRRPRRLLTASVALLGKREDGEIKPYSEGRIRCPGICGQVGTANVAEDSLGRHHAGGCTRRGRFSAARTKNPRVTSLLVPRARRSCLAKPSHRVAMGSVG
jgi:hypothetical protein